MTLDNSPTRKELTAIARFANAVSWRLSHRDNLVAKVSGPVTGGRTPPTLSAHTSGPLKVIAQKIFTCNLDNFVIIKTSAPLDNFSLIRPEGQFTKW
jgi:hypothetical protein